ncbi:LCP family protein [Actinopolyspora saharensis]|uniref:LCP family protein n=1 Tax=Actinopolyspora saharensis TaxID=995062 RepID=UPI003F675536
MDEPDEQVPPPEGSRERAGRPEEAVPGDEASPAEQAGAERSSSAEEVALGGTIVRGDTVPGRSARGRRGGTARRAARIALRSLVVLVSVTTLAFTAASWSAVQFFRSGLSTTDVLSGDVTGSVPEDTATDILLVGSDSRTDAQGNPLPPEVLKLLRTESTSGLNTDTIILVRIPDDGSAATAVSIPRDTAVSRSGGTEKINGVYGLARSERADELRAAGGHTAEEVADRANRAGQRALVQTVQQLTGVRVDHYAKVNLLGFYEVTKALGGVRVCLRRATSDKDSGADFRAGPQVVSGADALAFVRQRHGLPDGDLDRVVRQQVFMAAVTDKLLSTGTLTDTAKLNRLVDAARKSVVLDSDWKLMDFVSRMQSLASGRIGFTTIPVEDPAARDERGRSVVSVDNRRVRRFFSELGRDVDSGAPSGTTSSAPETSGTTSGSAPGSAPKQPTHRLTGSRSLMLDGADAAGQSDSAPDKITADGIPCVY